MSNHVDSSSENLSKSGEQENAKQVDGFPDLSTSSEIGEVEPESTKDIPPVLQDQEDANIVQEQSNDSPENNSDEGTDNILIETPESEIESAGPVVTESSPRTKAKHYTQGDSIAAEADIERMRIYTGSSSVEGKKVTVNNFFQDTEGRPKSDELKQLLQKPDFSKEQLDIDELCNEKKTYFERPGYSDAFQLLQRERLLLLTGPVGCGLRTTANALCYDLYLKTLKSSGRVYALPTSLPYAPDRLLQEDKVFRNSVILFEGGLQIKQAIAVRLFEEGQDSFDRISRSLQKLNSWIILTGSAEPSGRYAQDIYSAFERSKKHIDIGMPNMQMLFTHFVEYRFGSQSKEILEFLTQHFQEAMHDLRTSQDVEHFARRCQEIIISKEETDAKVDKIHQLFIRLDSVQNDVRYLLEEQLKTDDEVILAVLLSILNETEASFFWQVYDFLVTELDLEQKKKKKKKKDDINYPARSVFTHGRVERLDAIQAEEVVRREVINGEEVAYKVVRYVDDRYPGKVLEYARTHYEKQIVAICDKLQTPFIEQQRNNVGKRIIMAKAIASLAQTNWNGVLQPILYDWAMDPRQYMRATVGYAVDQVLQEETYAGNVRYMLNEWATASIGGEISWNLKWTVASVCKHIGLTDIGFGLEYLRKLATNIGQRDLHQVRSFDEFALRVGDSAIESHIVYDAIQYSMMVFCLQGYIEFVMEELKGWINQPVNESPLSLIATSLLLGIFQQFGFMAENSQQAAQQTNWAEDTLDEWGIQVYSSDKKPLYIYNRILQYYLIKIGDRDLFSTLALAIARAFAITKQVNGHRLIYAIFFQWADELGVGMHISDLRDGFGQIQKLFVNVCRFLKEDDLEEIRGQIKEYQEDKRLPEHVQEFARRILRDLNAPSIRYTRRV